MIGDGMITPALSVLAAVEGLGVAIPGFAATIIPVTLLQLADKIRAGELPFCLDFLP